MKSAAYLLIAVTMASAGRASATEPDAAATKRRSVPLMIAGIVLGTLGTGSAIAGGVMYADADATARECRQSAAESSFALASLGCSNADFGKYVAIPMIAGGGALFLAGAPMTIIGAWPVPDRSASIVPEVRVAAGQTSLRWRF